MVVDGYGRCFLSGIELNIVFYCVLLLFFVLVSFSLVEDLYLLLYDVGRSTFYFSVHQFYGCVDIIFRLPTHNAK